ncbi:MAG: cytochrome b5 domain-containing protein [Desulfovibrionaceae bacterium]
MSEQKQRLTLEDLAKNNGQNGQPAYVAYKGRVYDVSKSKMWGAGKHMNRHHAGRDLTESLKDAPHQADVLDRYPQVGELVGAPKPEPTPERRLPAIVERFPFLKRHPHPMTVHFPIAFPMAAFIFAVLYKLFAWNGFNVAMFNVLALNVVFAPVAIATGYYTWWLNYYKHKNFAIRLKLILAPTIAVLSLILAVWWLVASNPLATSSFYFLLVVIQVVCVGLVGWFGASLTFPTHED